MHDGAGEPADGIQALLRNEFPTRRLNGITHRVEGAGETAEFIIAVDG
jgi:hypothetical protein